MASQWFCKVLGQEVGPVSFRAMAEMVRAGTLKKDDPVRREGTSQWTRAREVIGLFRDAAKEPVQAQREAKAEPKPAPAPAKTKEAEPPPRPPQRIGRRQVLLAGGLVVGLVLLVGGISAWRANTQATFPEPRQPQSRPVQEDVLAPLLAKRPHTASAPAPIEPIPEPVSADGAEWKARFTLDFQKDFQTQAIDLIGGPAPGHYFAVEPAGLRVTIPEDSEVTHCAAAVKIRVKGDFQITARYTILNLAPPTKGYGTGVGVSVEEAEGERASVERKLRVSEGHVYLGSHGKRRENGTYQYRHQFHATSSEALSGWLRLKRVGGSIRCQIAGPHSERFVQIHEEEFPLGELAKVRLKAQTGDSPTPLDAVWSYIDVQAEELVKKY